MRRSPRKPDEPIVSLFPGWRIFYVSFILLAGTFGLFIYERAAGTGIGLARTIAVNTLVMLQVFYLHNCRYLHRSVLSRAGLAGNPLVLIAIAVVIAL